MSTKETRLARGRRRGRMLASKAIKELREARITAGLSQAKIASELGLDPSTVWRLEAGELADLGIVRLSEFASVLGHEISLGFHPIGDGIRDAGQQACASRFDHGLSDRWQVTNEALLPGAGERRAWDKQLRLIGDSPRYLVGVDIESRVWDVQAIVRRTRERERDGRVDQILIVLADTAYNRRIIHELRRALGDRYATSPRVILASLREGRPLPGSGVVLI